MYSQYLTENEKALTVAKAPSFSIGKMISENERSFEVGSDNLEIKMFIK